MPISSRSTGGIDSSARTTPRMRSIWLPTISGRSNTPAMTRNPAPASTPRSMPDSAARLGSITTSTPAGCPNIAPCTPSPKPGGITIDAVSRPRRTRSSASAAFATGTTVSPPISTSASV